MRIYVKSDWAIWQTGGVVKRERGVAGGALGCESSGASLAGGIAGGTQILSEVRPEPLRAKGVAGFWVK